MRGFFERLIPHFARLHAGYLLRQKLNVSQAVFAQYLRINKRTLENWEQGRAKPNAQAAVLIKMVEKYPDTLSRLASV